MDDHRLDPPRHLTSRLEKISWLWTEINRSILEQLEALPVDAYTSLAVEGFSDSSVGDLLQFIGVERRDELIADMLATGRRRPNHTKDYTIPPFEKWDDKKKSVF
jgi:hypothetical protein